MKLELENKKGFVIIDDNTGKIINVFVDNVVEGKWDSIATRSYSNNPDGTHTVL